MKKSILFLTALSVLASCSNSDKNKTNNSNSDSLSNPQSSITPPVEGVNNPSETFAVTNTKGCVKKSKRGTFVIVPPNAFVNKDGTPVTGDVDVKLTEIFTPSEIILSGIPMNVSDKGTIKPFISDGMFDIQATCNNQEVKIAEGKALTVCNESKKDNKDFDYWYLNQSTGQWDNIGDRTETVNEESVLRKAQEVNPEQVSEYRKLMTNTEVSSIKAVRKDAIVKSSDERQISNFTFTLNANYDNSPELKAYKNMLWKPAEFMSESDEQKFKSELNNAGSNVYISKSDKSSIVYNLNYGSNKTLKVTPVLFGKDKEAQKAALSKADKAYSDEYEKQKQKTVLAQESINNQQIVYNTFAVMQLGTYNCDRFYNSSNNDQLLFTLDEKELDNKIYVVLENNQGVVCVSGAYKQKGTYRLPTSDIKSVIHIKDDGQIFGTTMMNKNGQVYYASVQDMNANVKDPGKLEKVINSL